MTRSPSRQPTSIPIMESSSSCSNHSRTIQNWITGWSRIGIGNENGGRGIVADERRENRCTALRRSSPLSPSFISSLSGFRSLFSLHSRPLIRNRCRDLHFPRPIQDEVHNSWKPYSNFCLILIHICSIGNENAWNGKLNFNFGSAEKLVLVQLSFLVFGEISFSCLLIVIVILGQVLRQVYCWGQLRCRLLCCQSWYSYGGHYRWMKLELKVLIFKIRFWFIFVIWFRRYSLRNLSQVM